MAANEMVINVANLTCWGWPAMDHPVLLLGQRKSLFHRNSYIAVSQFFLDSVELHEML